jgi:hypothetical protein
VKARFVRRRADDSSTARRAADDEQLRLAGALRIYESSDRDEERVGVGEENPAWRWGLLSAIHERRVARS